MDEKLTYDIAIFVANLQSCFLYYLSIFQFITFKCFARFCRVRQPRISHLNLKNFNENVFFSRNLRRRIFYENLPDERCRGACNSFLQFLDNIYRDCTILPIRIRRNLDVRLKSDIRLSYKQLRRLHLFPCKRIFCKDRPSIFLQPVGKKKKNLIKFSFLCIMLLRLYR